MHNNGGRRVGGVNEQRVWWYWGGWRLVRLTGQQGVARG